VSTSHTTHATLATRTTVVVAGGGPVGLTAALLLARAGVDVTVFEGGPELHTELRASTFHAATLDLLEPSGLTQAMVDAGLAADVVRYFDRQEGLVAEFDHAAIADATRFPFRLQLEQYKYAQLVLDRLLEEPTATVRFGHEVVAVQPTEHGATTTVRSADGTAEVVADFVIGADGARGAVRKSLGLEFEGWTYEQRFLLISTRFPFEQHLPELCYVNYMADPEEFVMLLRIPDVWRVLVPVPVDEPEAVSTAPERLSGVLARILPEHDDWAGEVLGHQIYNVHQRVAERLRVGHVVLAGDAAHMNSPMGGFGLNSGIHDAIDLATRLGRILASDGDEELVEAELDAYDVRRRTIALDHVRAMSHRNTSMLTERDPVRRAELIEELRRTAADPEASRAFLLDASMISLVAAEGIGVAPG
jgi:2-polyprenyl-6-methoxyphenol hydroxylase-like FAD-dependent oxidoreductase